MVDDSKYIQVYSLLHNKLYLFTRPHLLLYFTITGNRYTSGGYPDSGVCRCWVWGGGGSSPPPASSSIHLTWRVSCWTMQPSNCGLLYPSPRNVPSPGQPTCLLRVSETPNTVHSILPASKNNCSSSDQQYDAVIADQCITSVCSTVIILTYLLEYDRLFSDSTIYRSSTLCLIYYYNL